MTSTSTDPEELSPRTPKAPKYLADQGYSRNLKVSAIIHGILLSAVVLQGLVFPSKPKPYVPTLRVDMVGLPDVLKKDLSHLPPPASTEDIAKEMKKAADEANAVKPVQLPKEVKAPEKEIANKDDMVLKPKKVTKKEEVADHPEKAKVREKKNKSALDRIKALSKIAAETSEESRPSAVVKGNKLSKGTSLSGDAREGEANYLDSVRNALQENWELPVWLARQNLSAHVQIRIDGMGRVREIKFVKASGNAQFDAAIKRTITASVPLPKPTEDVAASMQIDGILVKFPL